ncbi:hypothetical protein TD95_003429 [Thielaviopsis punctulata]|uniref:Uncharacterized protein n=1 Tax=Thielaviopsis punctulata TaxID=72032 RepID=A0A0F4ZDX3_9PEZI|nr:hypothetical protein TD95_003429 [Thielaviopsis punctulata]
MSPPTVFDTSYYGQLSDGTVTLSSRRLEVLPTKLLVNLIFRVVVGTWSLSACIVPLRLLYRNGEFAAVVCIIAIMILTVFFVLNALIWHNQDTSTWWNGVGYCDMNIYLTTACQMSAVGSVFAIMRNLSININVLRASPLTHRERKQKNLVQALIIFVPVLIQLGWLYPITTERYSIMPLTGCYARTDPSWPVMFFIVPEAVYPIGTAIYAVLIYVNFRKIRKSNSAISNSSNPIVCTRNDRASRRLYLMSLSILIPYLPCALYVVASNLRAIIPFREYDFKKLHGVGELGTWNTVIYFVDEWALSFPMNYCWVYPLFALPIFLFFGLSTDAINEYRVALVKCGFAKIWPGLLEEYSPYRTYQPSWLGSILRSSTQRGLVAESSSPDTRGSVSPEKKHQISMSAVSGSPSSSFSTVAQPSEAANPSDASRGPMSGQSKCQNDSYDSANALWEADIERGIQTTCWGNGDDESGVDRPDDAQRRGAQGHVLDGVNVYTDIERCSEPVKK